MVKMEIFSLLEPPELGDPLDQEGPMMWYLWYWIDVVLLGEGRRCCSLFLHRLILVAPCCSLLACLLSVPLVSRVS